MRPFQDLFFDLDGTLTDPAQGITRTHDVAGEHLLAHPHIAGWGNRQLKAETHRLPSHDR